MTENAANYQATQEPIFNHSSTRWSFIRRVLIIIGLIALIMVVGAALWQGTEVILLVFAGLLLAIFLRSIGGFLSKYLPLSQTWALAIVLLAIIGLVILGGWLLALSVQKQFTELSDQLPAAIAQARERVADYPFGQTVVDQIPQLQQAPGNQSSNVFGRVTGFFSTALGIVANILIVLITAIYFAFNPKLYETGVLKLVPRKHEKRASEILETMGITLQKFLLGISCSMIINGTLTFLGLWFLGIPFAIPLGIIAGLLSFIPNIGPIAASVPAILIALAQSPTTAFYVLLLYLAVQNLDGFLLTPLIQQRAVSIPPVLVIAAQLLLGVLFGFLGLLLAVPITAVVFVAVKMIYVEDILGRKIGVKGEKQLAENQSPA